MPDDLLERLQANLDQARSKYQSATDSLKKLSGLQSFAPSDRKRTIGVARRDSENGGGDVTAAKRPREGVSVFQRLAVPPHPRDSRDHRQAAAVPVLPALAEHQRARKAAIEELAAAEDSEVRARNRRMFGVMLGTLKQFTAAERDRERQLNYQQRRELEQRVEEGVMRDQDRLRRECDQLSRERKRRQAEIEQLEAQVCLVELHAVWRQSTEQLRGSIRTLADSHPHRLYYRPKVFCERARRRRELSARQVDAEVAERGRRLQADVERAVREAVAAAEAAEEASEEDADVAAATPAAVGTPRRLLSSVAIVVPPPPPAPAVATTSAASSPASSKKTSPQLTPEASASAAPTMAATDD